MLIATLVDLQLTDNTKGMSEMIKTLRWLLIITLVLVLFFTLIYGVVFAQVLIRVQRVAIETTPADYGLPYEDVEMTTEDGLTLRGWYIPPDAEDADSAAIFLHGLSSNRLHFIQEAKVLHEAGYGALLYDMRGHGASDGQFSSLGANEVDDVAYAIDFLGARGIEDIVVIGESVGGATALMATERYSQVQGVIAISAFSSPKDLINDLNGRLGLPELFDNLVIFWMEQFTNSDMTTVTPLTAVDEIESKPVLVMHGGRDTTVPMSHARRLFDATTPPNELWIIPEGGHGIVGWLRGEEYATRLVDFMETALARP